MVYLVKYIDKYDFGNRIFHYFDNDKAYNKYINQINDDISQEMKLGQQFTSYKVYRYSSKEALIDTLLNSINHSGLNVDSDIISDIK